MLKNVVLVIVYVPDVHRASFALVEGSYKLESLTSKNNGRGRAVNMTTNYVRGHDDKYRRGSRIKSEN